MSDTVNFIHWSKDFALSLNIVEPKNWCFWIVMLEKTLESPLACKEIKPVHPKGNQSWIFIGRTDAEAEAPILWPTDAKSQLTGKDPDAGKDGRREEGTTEIEMVGWHHWLNGHEFEQVPGEGQESLACYSPWAHKELNTTERLNNSKYCCIPLNTGSQLRYLDSTGFFWSLLLIFVGVGLCLQLTVLH